MLRLLLLIVLVEGATQAHANEETEHAKQKEEIVGRAHHSLRKLRRHGHHDAQQQLTAASVYAVGYSVSADAYIRPHIHTHNVIRRDQSTRLVLRFQIRRQVTQ